MRIKTKSVPRLSEADIKATQESVVLARNWREPVFAIMDQADKSDTTVSGFIFARISEAPSVQAADLAFVALESAYRDAHAYQSIVTHGPKAGDEITVRPAIPASWKTQKSRLLRICKSGPELAARAIRAETLLAAQKAMHLDQDAILKMYNLTRDGGLDCRNERYKGDLRTYQGDVRAVEAFVARFGEKDEAAHGLAAGREAAQSKLPDWLLTALGNLAKKSRAALEAGAQQQLIENVVLAAITAMDKVLGKATDERKEAALKRQRLDSIASAKRGRKNDRAAQVIAEAEPVQEVAAS